MSEVVAQAYRRWLPNLIVWRFLIRKIFGFSIGLRLPQRVQPTLMMREFYLQCVQLVTQLHNHIVQLLDMMLVVRKQLFELHYALP